MQTHPFAIRTSSSVSSPVKFDCTVHKNNNIEPLVEVYVNIVSIQMLYKIICGYNKHSL